jgi:hypothetical protein
MNDSFVADAPLPNAGAAISLPTEVVDTDTSTNTVQRRSKRTRARQPSNDVEPIGDEAEEANVEFEAVDEPFIAENEEAEAEIVARNPGNTRMLKEIECALDGSIGLPLALASVVSPSDCSIRWLFMFVLSDLSKL